MGPFRKGAKPRDAAEPVPVDTEHGVEPEGAQGPSVPAPDYYDWKARYRPWAGLGMIGPVIAGAVVLGLLVLVLLAFVFHPSW